MSRAAIIYILAIFILGMLIPVPWPIALVLMFVFYYVSPQCIAWIDSVLWKMERKWGDK